MTILGLFCKDFRDSIHNKTFSAHWYLRFIIGLHCFFSFSPVSPRSGIRKYVVWCLICGGLSCLLGIMFLGVYFLVRSYTSTIGYFETVPTFVPATLVSNSVNSHRLFFHFILFSFDARVSFVNLFQIGWANISM